jgi:glycosyltransferase involved in cell wall biosynthesis
MRIVNLSYSVPNVKSTNPEDWLKMISHSTGFLEKMGTTFEVISIYNINCNQNFQKSGVTYLFRTCSKWELWVPIRFNFLVKKMDPDVVIVNGLMFPWQIVMLRWQVGKHIKILAQHHAEKPLGDIRQYFQQWADRYIAAYLFCSSELAIPWVQKRQIRHAEKIKEVMEASSHFRPMEKKRAREITKVTGDPVFLWVGRLDENKDPLTVVKAFARFSSVKPNARLYLIFQSDELLDDIKRFLIDSHTSKIIHLVGKIGHDEIQNWYSSADFIISSSHYEGSGVSICEGLSCGCIPILTNIPSFRMMSRQGTIGILFEPGNIESLFTAFKKTQEIDLATERQKALEQFKSTLSFDAISKKIMNVIDNLQ